MSYFGVALVEVSMLGVLSGIAGTLIVLRRRSFFAVALSHATFPGGVIFAVLGWNLLVGQALFAVILVFVMTLLARVPGQGRQVSSGVVLSFGFAFGTLLLALHRDLSVPVEALLVGSPLSVSRGDIAATASVLGVCLVAGAVFQRRIMFHTFDVTGFRSAGFRVWPVEFVVTAVITASVVVSMPAVGAMLGVAILIGPAAAARLIAPGVVWIAPIAATFGVVSGVVGLWVSRVWGVAAGGAIGLTVLALFLLVLAGKVVFRER